MSPGHDSDIIADILWGLWGQLGISSVVKTDQDPLIDIEPLIVLTAWFINQDLRLSEEVIRWCAGHAEWVSKTRLTSLYKGLDKHWQGRFAFLAAAVHRSNNTVKWPGFHGSATTVPSRGSVSDSVPEEPAAVFASSKGPPLPPHQDRLPFHRPGNLRFRLRALLGVGTRADVLTHVIFSSMVKGCDFAYLGYSKPAITHALSSLQRGGFVMQREEANAYAYALVNRESWESLLQYQPVRFLNLRAIGNILVTWRRRCEHQDYSSRSARVTDLQAAKAIRTYATQLNPIRANEEHPHWLTQGNTDLDAISQWIRGWSQQLPGPMGP
ncbi:MAG: hypothetical protein EA401_09405 [Planctomycetota bacterium]|nr:MAG: hypothetical protein EA401_09405 [Planctomycetota bacterium]